MQHPLILLLTSAWLILGHKPLVFQPIVIEGVVLEATTHQPLPNAFVFTVKGEEEALTNERGLFVIKTWRSLPVTLTVQQGGKEKKITIKSLPKKLTIRL
jgi:hypothetical protein